MKNDKMTDYSERNDMVYPSLRIFKEEKNEKYGYEELRGVVDHKLGMVEFFQYRQWLSEYGRSYFHDLRLSIIFNGREYTRSWSAWYGKKTIARLANEFIQEVCKKSGNENE